MPPRSPLPVAVTVEQVWQPVPGGSGTYVSELCAALLPLGAVHGIGIAARHADAPPADLPVAVPVRHSRLPRRALYESWQRLGLPRAEHLVPEAEVVHATTWAVPPTRRPLVVTVHDVAFLHDPSHFTTRGNRYFRRALDHLRTSGATIVTPSRVTADDCVAVGLPPGRIHVVPHGVSLERPDDAVVRDWRRRFGVEREFVLWCGTVEPRKNLAGLLDAFSRAQLDDLDLVLVGPAGWGRVPPLPPGLDASRVHVLGRLERADLAAAYSAARAFCFPSFREGFGLPVLEAMRLGTPVVTSSATACAEVAGDAALLADPHDHAGLADALREAVGGAHAELRARGLARASLFTWTAAAEATASVYVDAAQA